MHLLEEKAGGRGGVEGRSQGIQAMMERGSLGDKDSG
jgi:hypothetical protein